MRDDKLVNRINVKRQYPVLRLIEVPGIALSASSVTIATVASVILSLSGWLLGGMTQPDGRNVLSVAPSLSTSVGFVPRLDIAAHADIFRPWWSTVHPAMDVLSPTWNIENSSNTGSPEGVLKQDVDTEGQLPVNHTGHPPTESKSITTSFVKTSRLNDLLQFVLALGLWSCVGTILCRRSAMLFAGDGESTVQRAIDFGLRRWRFSLAAPLIPLSAVAVSVVVLFAFGLVGRLPFLGWLWLTITSPALATIGFVMAFLLIATALVWPIMIAAVATDDCDSFGGLSRAYSGLTGRPWHFLVFIVIGVLLGAILMTVVDFVSRLAFEIALSGVASGAGTERANESLLVPLTNLIGEVIRGIGISYFWSVSTVIYLLLRREVDGVPLDRLAPDDDARPVREPYPVVGIPATDAYVRSSNHPPSDRDTDVK